MNLTDAIAKLTAIGYQERVQQTEMMTLIEQTLAQKSIAVIEGGTGIGKTFGYLIPLLLKAKDDTYIVIATATVNLQAQLAEIDIPQLQKILGRPIHAEIAKGRRRYVCLSRLYQKDTSQGELLMEQVPLQIETLIENFETRKWDGDKDTLATFVHPQLWQQLTTDAVGCTNRRCAFFEDCPYFKARKRLTDADIIIANHDLLLSDIMMGTGSILPAAEKTTYVIDEAHHFPQKAVQHFSSALSLHNAQEWLDTMIKGTQSIFALTEDNSSLAYTSFVETCQVVKAQLGPIFEWVDTHFEQQQQNQTWLLSENPKTLIEVIHPLILDCKKIFSKCSEVRAKLMEINDINPIANIDQHLAGLGYHIHHSELLYRTFELFCYEEQGDEPPIARWFAIAPDTLQKSKRPNYICHAARISAAPVLAAQFWNRTEQAVILCSATLRSLGKFDDFLQKAGLEFFTKVKTAAFLSPFDYQKSRLHIPFMKTTPQGESSAAHTEELCEILPGILAQQTHGVLVLFTSQRVMSTVYEAMPLEIKQHIFLQGALPKSKLMQHHKAQVDQEHLSIIFGLQSFAEGVDLPGRYCHHVIITKLPFSVPSTPIEKTWVKWLERLGKNSFKHHVLPDTALRLTQYAGRLIRTQEDIGTLTILDRRIVSKFYGKQLLASLPPFRIEVDANPTQLTVEIKNKII
jgi:ATP-dependent DNA helicase DinG